MVFAGITLPLVQFLLFNRDTHAACGTCDHAHSCLDAACVQVRHLHLCNLSYLVLGDSSYLCLVRNSGTRLQVASLLQQNCCRRSLCDEAEASVCVNRDNYRNDQVALISGSCIELFCELNNINTMLAKSRSNWWCWCCFASRNL